MTFLSGNTDGPQFLTDLTETKSKQTCIYKSKQTLYICKHILLIHKRVLSSNQLSFESPSGLPDKKVV